MFHHLGVKPADNFYIMAIVFLCVYIYWFLTFNKEASAPPIIINTTKTKKDLEGYMYTASSQEPGKSGLTFSGLAQPCVLQGDDTTKANLPTGYSLEPCDTHNGLECVTGIYKGGGICLKSVNQTCYIKSDCAPEAEFCLNNLCQTRDEVINRSCKFDDECKGPLGNLNHVCDFKTKKCVYDIWPKDSGCVNNSQCKYFSQFPDGIECRTGIGGSASAVLLITGEYKGTSINISSSSLSQFNEIKSGITNVYVSVIEKDSGNYQGRLRIKSIDGNNVTLVVPSLSESTFKGKQNTEYDLEFGTDKDGICLVKFPTGTSPSAVVGTNGKVMNDCISGNKLSNSYCVEEGRLKRLGELEQVCTSDTSLFCDQGACLTCTYDEPLVLEFNSLIKSYHVDSGLSVNGQIIKDIGKCKKQVTNLYEPCSDNCKKPLICLTEADVNFNVFRYCGYEWDVMNDVSDLTGCPLSDQKTQETGSIFNFVPGKFHTQCKSALNSFCFTNSDCVSNKCGGQNKERSFRTYNPLTNKYTFNKQSFPGNNSSGENLRFLASNTGTSNGPDLILYYNEIDTQGITLRDQTYVFNLSKDGGKTFPSKITVEIDEEIKKDPVFSLTQLENGSYQLNIEYITEYLNSRRREFNNPSAYNFLHSGLRDGTSIYFEDDPNLYRIKYSSGYITPFPVPDGCENVTILKVDKIETDGSIGPSINVTPGTGTMTTYSSIISGGMRSTAVVDEYLPVENVDNSFHSGDVFTYFEGTDANNSITYINNSSGTSILKTDTDYFSAVFDKSSLNTGSARKEIYFTEKYNTVNANPVLDGVQMNNFEVRVKANPNFSSDNSYIQLKPVYGYNFLPININTSKEKTFTINKRKDYVSEGTSNYMSFNKPIGYFSDTNDITSEITHDSILLTYKYDKNTIQTLSMNYNLTGGLTNFNKIDLVEGSCYIYYNINNSLRLPNLKVTSDVDYSITDAPYDIDQVRYFENNSQTDKNFDTVSFLSTYKNIFPKVPRSSISNISTMRKLSLQTKMTSVFGFLPQYKGLNINSNLSTGFSGPLPFGLTGYKPLSQISAAINSTDSSGNLFLEGTDSIIFKNQGDIETILKYGSSDLIISYNSNVNAVAIVGIKEYNVDDKGKETLEVKTSFILDSIDTLGKDTAPVLYFNNIYPAKTATSFTGAFRIQDGRVLVSSSKDPDNRSNFPTTKSNYNKILYQLSGAPTNTANYSFFDFYFIENGFQSNPFNGGKLDKNKPVLVNWTKSGNIYADFATWATIYMDIVTSTYPATISSPYNSQVYLINNQYLSSTSLYSNQIFLNNNFYTNNITVLGIGRSFGGILMKNNTFPFYTGLKDNEGMLDETYLKEIQWPYWIKNLNTGSVIIRNIFLNYNSGVNMLLYFSTNFNKNDIKESHSVPIVVSKFEEMYYDMKMLPYNKNLLLFSKSCTN